MKAQWPRVSYKETIRWSTNQHGRYKRQTGGHGRFGDAHLTIEPLPRGTGSVLVNIIIGGAVPKQYSRLQLQSRPDVVRGYFATVVGNARPDHRVAVR